ncbi:MAG: hypothetical protein ACRDZY_00575 [Acidimicrobiales bacterium]
MTAPDYVPLQGSDRMRPSDRLSLPRAWRQDRPAELVDLAPPTGERFGSTGPDLGYGLKLAKRFEARLVLSAGETRDDAVAGCFACGAKRSGVFDRAPVIYDMEWAYTLWGYLGGAPDGLVHRRVERFRGASHHYWDQRGIVDSVAAEAFRLTPVQVRERLGSGWETLFIR